MNRKKVIQKTDIKYGRQKMKWIKGKIKNIQRVGRKLYQVKEIASIQKVRQKEIESIQKVGLKDIKRKKENRQKARFKWADIVYDMSKARQLYQSLSINLRPEQAKEQQLPFLKSLV